MGDTKLKPDDGGPSKSKTLKMGQRWWIQGQTRKSGKLEHSNASKTVRGEVRKAECLDHGELVGQVKAIGFILRAPEKE